MFVSFFLNFSVLFSSFWVFPTKKSVFFFFKKKNSHDELQGKNFKSNEHFQKGEYTLNKRGRVVLFKKYHLHFLQKFTFLRKPCFQIHMHRGSRARLKALLTITACRDVVERIRSMCTYLSLISAPGHSLHQPISLLFSPLFISHLFSFNVFLWPLCSFAFFQISSLHLFFKTKTPMAENSLFPSYISLLLFSFSSRFSCERDLMAEDRTRHQEKWVKAVVGLVTKVSKRGLLLACFFQHDWGSELMDQNQPRRMPRLIF